VKLALVLVAATAATAQAEDIHPQAAGDGISDDESKEANLESQSPRKELTITVAAGGGLMFGGDLGVGRGPAFDLRLGGVATRHTVITFEFVGSGALHKKAMTGEILTDSNYGLFTGAQQYVSSALWVRAAGGIVGLTKNLMTDGSGGTTTGGVGGLAGAGLELFRSHNLVFGLEGYGLSSVTPDGYKLQISFSASVAVCPPELLAR
jgi:hypothetical protein